MIMRHLLHIHNHSTNSNICKEKRQHKGTDDIKMKRKKHGESGKMTKGRRSAPAVKVAFKEHSSGFSRLQVCNTFN